MRKMPTLDTVLIIIGAMILSITHGLSSRGHAGPENACIWIGIAFFAAAAAVATARFLR